MEAVGESSRDEADQVRDDQDEGVEDQEDGNEDEVEDEIGSADVASLTGIIAAMSIPGDGEVDTRKSVRVVRSTKNPAYEY
jgi:hypothetical protein